MITDTSKVLSALVIDDDDLTQELMGEMLRDLGIHDIRVAVDGKTALKTLSGLACAPVLLVCDIFMPEMDGFEFLEALSGLKFTGGIILMTGVDPEMLRLAKDIAQAKGLQVWGTFLKPVSMAQLKDALGTSTTAK